MHLTRVSFPVAVVGIAALSMQIPATVALSLDQHEISRSFFYHGLIIAFFVACVALALSNKRQGAGLSKRRLISLFLILALLPLPLALPLYQVLPEYGLANLYFEMVSCFTTTGATIFDRPEEISLAIHFWRGQVAWMGGFLVLLSAFAIMEPLNLGGFEVVFVGRQARSADRFRSRDADIGNRLIKCGKSLIPAYCGVTAILWFALLLSGQDWINAMIYAMSTISTSGITSSGTVLVSARPLLAEGLVFLFLFLATTRLIFSASIESFRFGQLRRDPEFRLALMFVIVLSIALLLFNWVGEAHIVEKLQHIFRSGWGNAFTVLSFLTTTGFESVYWKSSEGAATSTAPYKMLLVGLVITGGGVATTAGGVKLLRIYGLFAHGFKEMNYLIHPSHVAGSKRLSISREGALIAWVFFMLFILSAAATMLMLSVSGMDVETAVVLAIAALGTVGPLVQTAIDPGLSIYSLSDSIKLVMAVAMIVGRLELLVVVALLNPSFWRS